MKKKMMGLAGLFAAGCMLFSCSSEVKEANYQIIPIPQVPQRNALYIIEVLQWC